MQNFGKRLTDLRKDIGISVKDLAKELNLTEIALLYWERDRHSLSLSKVIKLARYFNVSIDYLLGL